jgi:hypothetical protein
MEIKSPTARVTLQEVGGVSKTLSKLMFLPLTEVLNFVKYAPRFLVSLALSHCTRFTAVMAKGNDMGQAGP